MSKKKGKGKSVTSLDDIQCAATQRILDSMPRVIDQIKAERERAAWQLRKAVREQEKARSAAGSKATGS